MKKQTTCAFVFRWTARVIGSIWAGLLVVIMGAEAFTGTEPMTAEGVALILLFSIAIAGVIIAWFREDIGGTVVALNGLAISVYAYYSTELDPGLAVIYTIPLFLSGLLFLAYWWRASYTPSAK